MDSNFLMQKIAETAPEIHQFLMASAAELHDSPFRDEVAGELQGMFEKVAFSIPWGGMGKHMGRAALGVGGTIFAGIGASLATDAFDSVKRGLTKSRDYKRMISENPDLQKHPMGAKSVQAIFSTLHRFNPEFAKDPYVAGTFVRNHLEMAGADKKQIDLGTLTNLITARKSLTETLTRKMPIMQKPWDSPIDRKRKEVDIQQIEGRLKAQPYELQKLKLDISRMEELTPLEKQRLGIQIASAPYELSHTIHQLEAHPLQMDKMRGDLNLQSGREAIQKHQLGMLPGEQKIHEQRVGMLPGEMKLHEQQLGMLPGEMKIHEQRVGQLPGQQKLHEFEVGKIPTEQALLGHREKMIPGEQALQQHRLGLAPGEAALQQGQLGMMPGQETKLPLEIRELESRLVEREGKAVANEVMRELGYSTGPDRPPMSARNISWARGSQPQKKP